VLSVFRLIEIATRRTDKYVFGMASISGNQIAWEKVYLLLTMAAGQDLYPKKVFDVRLC
jgi:hypothetical protein